MRYRRLQLATGLVGLVLQLAVQSTLAAPGGNGKGSDGPTPYLSFATDRTEVSTGENVQLSWSSVNTKHCFASGDWEGKYPTEGTHTTAALDGDKSYTLECRANGTAISATVRVSAIPLPQDPPEVAPTLTLEASSSLVAPGGSITLSWTATDADGCTASGGWNGPLPTSGNLSVGPIDAAASYVLSCTGAGGAVTESVAVDVAAEPTVALAAVDRVVSPGSSTTLSWSSTGIEACSAGGGWSGAKPAHGSELVSSIDESTTYSLSCTGLGGSAMAMISVTINDTVVLSWQTPKENTDGSPLTDLAGYRIYYGLASGSYSDSLQIDAAGATSHSLELTSGEYYFVMTAFDADANESAYSNEVVKVVP